MDWWKNAFSKTYADIFYQLFPEPTEQEVDCILKWFPVITHKKVLDLACGEGRHSIALARRGYQVTGVDISNDFLKIAYEKSMGLTTPPQFLNRDIRFLHLQEKFDLVLLIGNSFGYGIDVDQQSILNMITEHLTPNGSLLLAIPNGLKSIQSFQENNFVERKYKIDGDDITISEIYTFDRAKCIKSSVWMIEKNGKIIYEQPAQIRYYNESEIAHMFQEVKLEILKKYGNYHSEPFISDSPSLVIIGKKNHPS